MNLSFRPNASANTQQVRMLHLPWIGDVHPAKAAILGGSSLVGGTLGYAAAASFNLGLPLKLLTATGEAGLGVAAALFAAGVAVVIGVNNVRSLR